MGTRDQKKQQKFQIQEALLECADFLTCYLQLANAHPVDFITQDRWNRVLPQNIQKELSALTVEELHQLPSCQTQNVFHDCKQARTLSEEAAASKSDHSKLPSDVERLTLNKKEGPLPEEGLSSNKKQSMLWKHNSLQEFLTAVQEHCIEHLQCVKASVQDFSSWLGEKDDWTRPETVPFVRAFMKQKKMHEVEIMADLCAQIFNKCSADVVIDLGSGKGYLSTHLSLLCGLPVIGVDSQPHNTSGAAQRAEKLVQQWDSLVKHKEKKKAEKLKVSDTQPTAVEACDERKDGFNNDASVQKAATHADTDTIDTSKNEFSTCDTRGMMCGDPQGQDKSSNCEVSHAQVAKEKSKPDQKAEFLGENQARQSKSSETVHENQADKPKLINHVTGDFPDNNAKKSKDSGMCIAVTTFVSPDTKLTDLVKSSADSLCIDKACSGNLTLRPFLTGLHTCGSLATSMLRLFIQDGAVRAMCGVGCCYHLMQERFVDESGCCEGSKASQDLDRGQGDFPLSTALLERKMKIGLTALNVASLSLPRMTQTYGKLQGKTFYPRALLQMFIQNKLGYIPQDLKKLRKLAKQANSPPDYVIKAIRKLNISGCEASEEEVTAFHVQHSHQEEKMAAFFQLRATLAPVVETVVLLDRLLFLLEQDCVEDAFLVRLFDPVTSPRCHALIAIKKEHK